MVSPGRAESRSLSCAVVWTCFSRAKIKTSAEEKSSRLDGAVTAQ